MSKKSFSTLHTSPPKSHLAETARITLLKQQVEIRDNDNTIYDTLKSTRPVFQKTLAQHQQGVFFFKSCAVAAAAVACSKSCWSRGPCSWVAPPACWVESVAAPLCRPVAAPGAVSWRQEAAARPIWRGTSPDRPGRCWWTPWHRDLPADLQTVTLAIPADYITKLNLGFLVWFP